MCYSGIQVGISLVPLHVHINPEKATLRLEQATLR
jgi:hypothetical protein